jgi:hypothetical protein
MLCKLRCKSKESRYQLIVGAKELFLDGNNMTKDDLLARFKNTTSKKTVMDLARLAVASSAGVKNLIDLSFHSEPEIAFRSAWVLENAFLLNPDSLSPHQPYFLNAYLAQKNRSCQRHYTKILMYLSKGQKLHEGYDVESLINTTFEWLIDPKTPVAVQVNCMDILFNLKHCCDWLEEELKSQIVFLLKDGTAAMQSRGKKLLLKLNSLRR